MSVKPFEDFLVEQFLEWGAQHIKAGYRYQFQSPDSENSVRLFNSLIKNSTSEITIKNTALPVLVCGRVSVIPVLHSDNSHGFSENFISHLRDEVAGQIDTLHGCALLVIHNSMLDTLINSADNMAQEGAVWHPSEIKSQLHKLIDSFSAASKASECLLEHRFGQIIDDGATMFGFEELYKALLDGDLKFNELGLLNDPSILTWEGKPEQINKRLADNKKLFEQLDYITHHFPNDLVDKLSELDLGEKFVKHHFVDRVDSWKLTLQFGECEQERLTNRQNLLELETEDAVGGELIAKNKTDTGAGKRERHLLLVLNEAQSDFSIQLTFIGGRIEAKQCKIAHANGNIVDIATPDNTGGKRSRVTLSGRHEYKAQFFSFELKRDKTAENYKFRILVIAKGEFYIDAFRNNFLIEPQSSKKKAPRVTLLLEDNTLKISEHAVKHNLNENGQVFDNQLVGEIDFCALANESDELNFTVKGLNAELTFNVEGAIATDTLSLPLMLDTDRFVRLYKDDYFGTFNRSKNKVTLDNKEVSPKARRLALLQWEAKLVDERILGSNQIDIFYEHQLEENYPNLHFAYRALFDYYVYSKSLPSLCGWGPNFRVLVSNVVSAYLDSLNQIATDTLMSKPEKLLLNIGFATFDDKHYITPFHPLVLSYYLNLVEKIITDDSGSFVHLPKVTIDRLNARGLLPFIYDAKNEFAFSQTEKDNCFWVEFVPQQETSYAYVRKLVKEKVSEFIDAFSALFRAGSRSTLIINSVNNMYNQELFMGLVDIVKAQKDKVCHIHINLYDDELIYSEFDRFAETSNYDELKCFYDLDKGAIREQADAIIDLLRTKVTYSKFVNSKVDDVQAYAHLSFFRNNTRVQARDVNVDMQLSGVVCHGLVSGEAAANEQDSYFTAFGLRHVDTQGHAHLQIAKKLNGLIKPARLSSEPTSSSKSIALVVSDGFKSLLERSYKSSIWTTIIDPKVTLDFFASTKDMVLIHYSDNYTNSTNYDAITVTKQTDLYKKVLEQDEGGITEEFNAFNGEWLLKMITANANERKEKKGIIGAYKFVSCLLAHSDITWVPMSVAEMLRVAGNIGLKMSDSDFSRHVQGYKSGCISDDVLFVGFKDQKLYLLPLEVKVGRKQTHNKGVQQAKELKRYLTEDILGRQDLAGHLYRGLFIRQVLMQIDKYQLYQLYEADYFDEFIVKREWWLQGDYDIAEFENYPQGFMLSHVENDDFSTETFKVIDDILKIELPSGYLDRFVRTPLQQLMHTVKPADLCHIPSQFILQANSLLLAVENKLETHLEQTNIYQLNRNPEVLAVAENLAIDAENAFPTKDDSLTIDSRCIEPSNLTVLIGNDVRNQDAILWEPTNTAKFMNTNCGIIGTMGTGKTQCTKSVVTQLYRNQHQNIDGKPIGILIFDYKSDYVDDKFLAATNGKKYQLFKLPYNPLSLFGDTPMLPIHTAAGFSETMAKAYGLGPKQKLKLENLILEAYQTAGIQSENPDTWSRPAPTIENVWDLFLAQEKIEEDSLYAALSKLARFKIFETDTEKMMSLYELIDGVTVIELAGYPDEIKNLIVALTMDLFYSQMQKQGKPKVRGDFRQVTKLILVDEADNFMSQNFTSLRKVLKEGREYGVGVILSTQDITHFKTNENDYSAYILSWIVHRVSQIKNQDIKAIFNKDDKTEQENLMKVIRELDKHHSLYVDGDKRVKKIKDKAFWELTI